jgi:hypothetical protein
MVRYTVVAIEAGQRLVALRDDAGRYHAAWCRSLLPEIDRRLLGDHPALGIALLMDTSGRAYRMMFSQINFGLQGVFDEPSQGSLPMAPALPPPRNDWHSEVGPDGIEFMA